MRPRDRRDSRARRRRVVAELEQEALGRGEAVAGAVAVASAGAVEEDLVQVGRRRLTSSAATPAASSWRLSGRVGT